MRRPRPSPPPTPGSALAFTIPEAITSRPGSPTRGEARVFAALRDHLPEDYLVYYDISVGGRHPDFIIVGPDLGVVVLEVKDWRLDTIAAVTDEGVVLRLAEGERVVPDPVRQSRDYILRTVDHLKTRSLLLDGGMLRCGWGFGAVFPHLTTADLERPSLFGPSLSEALGEGLVLSGDDLRADALGRRLRSLVPAHARRRGRLESVHVDHIRATLFPEIRIGWGTDDAEIFRVMNREQERLARTLGEGHRLLRGVAGSGKTVCLIHRARHLHARSPEWRILVVCFNRILADHLREAIGADDRLEVLHFHRWCRRQLEWAGVPIPDPPVEGDRSRYWDHELPGLLLQAYEAGRLPPAAYQALLVDEGQDFADDWYRVLMRALDPATNHLFITVDASQSIYRRKVSWRGIGVNIVGRTRILRVNYRNTRPILSAAYATIAELDAAGRALDETADEYVVPEQALRSGPSPVVKVYKTDEAGRRLALDWIRERLARKVPPHEILLLVPSRAQLLELETWLADAGIPVHLLASGVSSGSVRLSTVHGAKGLDAEHVLLLGADQLENRGDAEARRLLYIAMTRARSELGIGFRRRGPLVEHLEQIASGGRGEG